MKKLLITFCWQGDEARVERHEPYWYRSGCDLLYSFPWDAPLRTRPGFCSRKSEQFGTELIWRHIETLLYASRSGYDHVYCTEADSICLKPAPDPPLYGMSGYIFQNDNPRFRAKTFLHWPIGMNSEALRYFVNAARRDADATREEFPDRWFSLMSERYDIPIFQDERAFSRNQFDTPELMAEAREAVKRGVWLLHGVKTEEQLRELLA